MGFPQTNRTVSSAAIVFLGKQGWNDTDCQAAQAHIRKAISDLGFSDLKRIDSDIAVPDFLELYVEPKVYLTGEGTGAYDYSDGEPAFHRVAYFRADDLTLGASLRRRLACLDITESPIAVVTLNSADRPMEFGFEKNPATRPLCFEVDEVLRSARAMAGLSLDLVVGASLTCMPSSLYHVTPAIDKRIPFRASPEGNDIEQFTYLN